MRFFRGIAVPSVKADTVISSITRDGLDRNQGWLMLWEKPADPERLLQNVDLSMEDTRGPRASAPVGICASGDEATAAFYAWKHNCENDTPILIEFEVEPDVVAIDGRDFLYAAFQLGNAEKSSSALVKLFGPNVLRYAHMAWSSSNGEKRIALCDLAVHNMHVVADHYRNKLVIAGRALLKFRNAFNIKLPIRPTSITRVWTPATFSALPSVDVDLREVI
jgi:hypothetical protein